MIPYAETVILLCLDQIYTFKTCSNICFDFLCELDLTFETMLYMLSFYTHSIALDFTMVIIKNKVQEAFPLSHS